jgi:hypothetical protein
MLFCFEVFGVGVFVNIVHYGAFMFSERDLDKSFLMPIEDVFSIAGRGTVVTGRVETGVVNIGDDLEIVGIQEKVRWLLGPLMIIIRKISPRPRTILPSMFNNCA